MGMRMISKVVTELSQNSCDRIVTGFVTDLSQNCDRSVTSFNREQVIEK